VNTVILRGRLSRPPTVRTLPSGDELVALEVTTRSAEGPAASVPVAWFDAGRAVDDLEAGTEIVVTGTVRRRFFRAGGATASRTEVVADAVVPARRRVRARRAVEAALASVDPGAAAP